MQFSVWMFQQLIVLAMSLLTQTYQAEPDKFAPVIIDRDDVLISGEIVSVGVENKSEALTTGKLVVRVNEKLRGDPGEGNLTLSYEYVIPNMFNPFPRVGWQRIQPVQHKNVLLGLRCKGPGQCNTLAVLDLDSPAEAKWVDAVKKGIELEKDRKSRDSEKNLLLALQSDNSLIRNVSRSILYIDCQTESCMGLIEERESKAMQSPDPARRGEALAALSRDFDKPHAGSKVRQRIIKLWFESLSDKVLSSYALDLLYQKLGDASRGDAKTEDLPGFSKEELKHFETLLSGLPQQRGQQLEKQKALSTLIQETSNTRKSIQEKDH